MKKNILFFTCFNERSIQLESIILYFKQKGYNVYLLTTCERGAMHKILYSKGIVMDTIKLKKSLSVLYYLKLTWFFIRYCKKNNIYFVHSHLQIPNLISSISRFFIKAKVFNVRHNSDVISISGTYKEKIIEKIINKSSNYIIAISDKVKKQLIEKENVSENKIYRINNGYNFEDYNKLSLGNNEIERIKNVFKTDFLILSPGRLINTKRHTKMIQVVKELIENNFQIKLLILGEGPEKFKLTDYINQNKLNSNVFIVGYKENISDYLIASDLIVSLSESEASSNVIKEAGFFNKPIIACENVGDFSDYIINNQNGYLVSKEEPVKETLKYIIQLYGDKNLRNHLGANLKSSILTNFSIDSVGKAYEELQNS